MAVPSKKKKKSKLQTAKDYASQQEFAGSVKDKLRVQGVIISTLVKQKSLEEKWATLPCMTISS